MLTMASDLSLAEVITLFGSVTAGVVAALALAGSGRSLYRRTVGKRRDLTRRLTRLGTGAQLEFFESVLGEPPAKRRRFEVDHFDMATRLRRRVRRPYLECLYINPLFYLQTLSDRDEAVVGFSITTRSRWFHPKLSFPRRPSRRARAIEAITFGHRRPGGTRIELGRTTFADARPTWNPRIRSVHANKHWSYTEAYWGGNPGYYQEVVFTASRVSPVARSPTGIETINWDDRPPLAIERPEWANRARTTSVITTMTVIAMGFRVEDWPELSVDGVRTLP
jgi:hypothetical protein